MAKPLAVELFCGVGGMTLGFEQAGFNVVAAFDVDKRNIEYHAINFPHSKSIETDVSKLRGSDILKTAGIKPGTLDVLFGGPPCQGFSEIGRRKNGDKRNLLFLDFARLIRELQPKYFVVENVRGLLFSYSEKILKSFLARVRLAGYQVAEPIRILDATQYGVPQKRKRAFILGYRKDLTPPTYPEPLSKNGELLPPPTVEDAISDLPDIALFDDLLLNDGYSGKLGKASDYSSRLRAEATNGYPQRGPKLTGCLRTVHELQTQIKFAATHPGTYEPSSRCYRLKLDGVAFTLRAGSDVNNGSFTAARPIHPTQARCITTREAARLHSFPDWFQFHPTKWHGFRQVGNAVPPLFAKAVALQVLQAIRANSA